MRPRRHAFILILLCVAVEAFTLGSAPDPDEYLTLNRADVIDLSPGPVSFGTHPVLLRPTGGKWEYIAAVSGHTQLRVGTGARARTIFVFVTPMPSRHVGRRDLNWYRTQFGAGFADCGPALVSMSILWARGVDIPVRQVRSEIGYPFANGATGVSDLLAALRRHKIASQVTRVDSVSDLTAVLQRRHLALLLIRSGGIDRVKGDPKKDLIGRYYDYRDGHYILAKGYSLDQAFFVVYDPYPADWDTNSMRYEDGKTMIGKNRYYPAPQVLAALKTHEVLEVLRSRAE